MSSCAKRCLAIAYGKTTLTTLTTLTTTFKPLKRYILLVVRVDKKLVRVVSTFWHKLNRWSLFGEKIQKKF